jgi:hypothetical protein
MSLPLSFGQAFLCEEGLPPAADAAGRTGTYVSLKFCQKAFVVYHLNQGNAATIPLTPQQATDSSGTSAKPIPAVAIYTNLDLAGGDVLTAQTAAASFTDGASLKHKLVIFELDVNALDTANGFNHVAAQTGASDAANITAAMIYLASPRYGGAAPPTSLV